MIRTTLTIALALVCMGTWTAPTYADGHKAASTAKPAPEHPMAEPKLEWSIKKVDQKLHIDYTITNGVGERIYVVDQLVEARGNNNFVRVEKPIVMNLRDPRMPAGTVKVVLGGISSDRPSAVVYTPTYRPIEPGKAYKGVIELPLPLVSYNPVGGTDPIVASPKSITLQIAYFRGEPHKWTTYPSKTEAKPISVPEDFDGNMLQTEAKPIPQ
jgi:hypothetical protein